MPEPVKKTQQISRLCLTCHLGFDNPLGRIGNERVIGRSCDEWAIRVFFDIGGWKGILAITFEQAVDLVIAYNPRFRIYRGEQFGRL